MSIYTDQLSQTITTTEKHSHILQYLSITFFIGIVITSVLFSINRDDERISLQADNVIQNQQKQSLPVQGVAGASEQAHGSTPFSIVDSQTNIPPIGIADSCKLGQLFIIGDKEATPLDNPADEFNWVDALDVSPDYSNPFIVNAHTPNQFPWRTDSSNPDTNKIDIAFNYVGTLAQADLVLSWSPGKQGEKQKAVMLDSMFLAKTSLQIGTFSEDNWEFMPLVQDTIPLILTPGHHTISIESISNGDGESVWDFVEMTVVGC